jgi:hypothetical protein
VSQSVCPGGPGNQGQPWRPASWTRTSCRDVVRNWLQCLAQWRAGRAGLSLCQSVRAPEGGEPCYHCGPQCRAGLHKRRRGGSLRTRRIPRGKLGLAEGARGGGRAGHPCPPRSFIIGVYARDGWNAVAAADPRFVGAADPALPHVASGPLASCVHLASCSCTHAAAACSRPCTQRRAHHNARTSPFQQLLRTCKIRPSKKEFLEAVDYKDAVQ